MSERTCKAFLFMEQEYDFDSGKYLWGPTLWKCQVDEDDGRIFIREIEVEVAIPEDFDPTAKQIAALERKRDEVRAQFAKDMAELNDRISKLQAITYEGGAA